MKDFYVDYMDDNDPGIVSCRNKDIPALTSLKRPEAMEESEGA